MRQTTPRAPLYWTTLPLRIVVRLLVDGVIAATSSSQEPPEQRDWASRPRGTANATARMVPAQSEHAPIIPRCLHGCKGPVAITGVDRLNQAAHRERWPEPLPPATF